MRNRYVVTAQFDYGRTEKWFWNQSAAIQHCATLERTGAHEISMWTLAEWLEVMCLRGFAVLVAMVAILGMFMILT